MGTISILCDYCKKFFVLDLLEYIITNVSHNNKNGQNLTPPPKKKQQKKNKLYIAESLAFDPKVLAFK